jgi:hypothetical protein
VVTVATRAPGFSLNEILYFDGRSHPTDIVLLGGHYPQRQRRLVERPPAAHFDLSNQNQTGKRWRTDHQTVPDKRNEK